MAAAVIIIRMTKIIAIAATIITNILTKKIIAVAVTTIPNIITNILMKKIIAVAVTTITTVRTRKIIAAVVTTILTRTNTRTSIIMNTANAAVTKRSIRRTITQATKIFCTTKKICPTS